MGLHFWLIPVITILGVGIGIFYLVIRRDSGSGARNEGRTLMDKPVEKEEPKAGWNFYGKP
jgi:hypothetical protein